MNRREPNDIDVLVSANLKRLRQERRLSLAKVASGIGVTWQQVQKYESAAGRIPTGRLAALAVYFQVGISALFAGTVCDDRPNLGADVLRAALALESMPDERTRKAFLELIMVASMEMFQPLVRDLIPQPDGTDQRRYR